MTVGSSVVYIPDPAEGYQLCHPIRSEDFETINAQVNGTPRRDAWQPIAMRLVCQDGTVELRESDSPWLGAHALILTPQAVEILGPLLSGSGELLPLACADATLSVLNPACVEDALDEGASTVQRFSGGRIMRVTRFVFRVDKVRALHAFKIPNLRVSPTFVSEEFVQRWSEANLSGLTFNRVWSE